MLRRPPQKERQEAKDSFRFFRVGASPPTPRPSKTVPNIDDDDHCLQINDAPNNPNILSKALTMVEEQQLFGGAMVASIPAAWRNVSLVRQVPGEEIS
jgi:hypothetical protein